MFAPPGPTVWTLGHSTRSFEEFLALLREHRIALLVDVRHFPASERVPWTNRDRLESSLAAEGIDYEHIADLGGYRRARKDSPNTGWRSGGFRGYADYMATPEFRSALERLLGLAAGRRTAIMCAEAVPWRCHRSLLGDALLVRGAKAVHILGPGSTQDHRLTSFAKVHGTAVTYPGGKAKG